PGMSIRTSSSHRFRRVRRPRAGSGNWKARDAGSGSAQAAGRPERAHSDDVMRRPAIDFPGGLAVHSPHAHNHAVDAVPRGGRPATRGDQLTPMIHAPVARALGLGLVAGAWIILSAWSPVAPAGNGQPAAGQTSRIAVAQADAAPAEQPVSYTAAQADRGKK